MTNENEESKNIENVACEVVLTHDEICFLISVGSFFLTYDCQQDFEEENKAAGVKADEFAKKLGKNIGLLHSKLLAAHAYCHVEDILASAEVIPITSKGVMNPNLN